MRGVCSVRHDTGADSAKTEVTMRFPVENCYNKVMVSESLDIFLKLVLLLLYSQIYLSYHIKVSYQIW